jgi:alanyl-tRNA synthetase
MACAAHTIGVTISPKMVYIAIEPFLGELFPALMSTLPSDDPMHSTMDNGKETILQVIRQEETIFSKALEKGLVLLKEYFANDNKNKIVDGRTTYVLHDRHGFPVDLTVEIAKDWGWSVDIAGRFCA